MMEPSQLREFHPLNTGLEQDIQALLNRSRRDRRPCERDTFLALLAGVPALRSTPGLPGPRESGPAYFTTLPRCASPADTAACREELKSVFGIQDKASLLAFCAQQFRLQHDYLNFEGIWEGRPAVDCASLKPDVQRSFNAARNFSAQFYPLVGHQGYLAWDLSEYTGHLRLALACGILTPEEFDALAEEPIAQAQIFGSWEEYAASLVCGALYWEFRRGTPLPELKNSQRLWMDLVRNLLASDAAWDSGLWYTPRRKKDYRLWPSQMKLYLPDWDGPNGCFVTDRVLVDGCRVGWCCRVEPETGFPDSGWRFFSGDESDAYIAGLSHVELTDLNSVCNYDPDILSLLNAPFRSAFVRREDGGGFRPEPYGPPEN